MSRHFALLGWLAGCAAITPPARVETVTIAVTPPTAASASSHRAITRPRGEVTVSRLPSSTLRFERSALSHDGLLPFKKDQLERCYAEQLERKPTTTGWLLATTTVSPAGIVAELTPIDHEGLSHALIECVLETRGFSVEPPNDGGSTYTVYLTFR